MNKKLPFDAHSHFFTQNSYYCREECCLDRRLEKEIPLEKQVDNVRNYLITHKTATLHCVRCTEKMLNILKELKPDKQSVIWHNFTGSKETAAILHSLGVIISIGPRFRGNLKDVCDANPLFVLETDYTGTDYEEYEIILNNHYIKCSGELGITVEELDRLCRKNIACFLENGLSEKKNSEDGEKSE